MTNSRRAVYSDPQASAQFADAATGVFRLMGEASQWLMGLQAQAATILLMDSAVLGVALMQACALMAFPGASAGRRLPTRFPDRRTDSVVIQFPDRRRNAIA